MIWNLVHFYLDYPGCSKVDAIKAFDFPNVAYNGQYELLKQDGEPVLMNYHAVFEKDDYCIWFAQDGFWNMGKCDNLGGNSVFILKEPNKECPSNIQEFIEKFTGSWFSGNDSLGKGVHIRID